MTRGLSVEDDKGCVIPASPLCHSRESGNPDRTRSPIRSASLSVEDDKGGSRLRITKGWNEILCKLRKL